MAKKATGKATRQRKTTERAPASRRTPRADSELTAPDLSQRYTKTRRDHSSEIAEDYVELIRQLIQRAGEARTVDIARHLGVSHVTVTKTIARLQRDGLVRTAPYRSIFLTEAGEKLALWSEARHEMVVKFLKRLGVDEEHAERDAEGMEHHLSDATMQAIEQFLKNER